MPAIRGCGMYIRLWGVVLTGLLMTGSGCCSPSVCSSGSCGPGAKDPPRVCEAPRWYWSNGKYWGCVDDYFTRRAATACAYKTVDQHIPRNCPHRDDFYDGYVCAHVDRAFGGCAQVPAVPPQKYWKANNRSAAGYARAEQWFAGYQAGLDQFNNIGRDSHLYVPSSVGLYPPQQCGPCSNVGYHQ